MRQPRLLLSTFARASVLALGVLGAAALSVACGPTVSEARLIHAEPREPTCELDFLEVTPQDVSPEGKYELLGHVVLGQEGQRDPLDESYRAQVRPRACRMGGEAIAVLMTGSSEAWALSPGGTTIDYGVLRKRRANTGAKPKKF
jgi:hypothetical protein